MILAVALGGALGAVSRYGVGHVALRTLGGDFPYATLIVNILGGFLMGVIAELFALKFSSGLAMKAFLTVGFLGGFTTFSTYSLEVALMVERGQMLLAAAYALGSSLCAVLSLFAGLALVRWSVL
jgi:CrcB protein